MPNDEPKNPIGEFLDEHKKTAAKRREDELNWLNVWRETQRPEDLQPLLNSYNNVLAQKGRLWRAPNVQPDAFHAELQEHLINAFRTYDPTRGAALPTHVENTLQKAKRYNLRNANLAYIPEGQARWIGPIQRAQDELREENGGRDPTHDEIGDRVGLPPARVKKVLQAQRRDIPASAFETDPLSSPLQRDEEVMSLLEYSLSPEELPVFNHLMGRNGAKKIPATNDLAVALGKHPSQISRLRSSILQKFEEHRKK